MSGYLLMKIGFSIIFLCLILLFIVGKSSKVIATALWSIVVIGCFVNIAGALKTQIPASTYENMFKPANQNQSHQKKLEQQSSQKTDIIPNWTKASSSQPNLHNNPKRNIGETYGK